MLRSLQAGRVAAVVQLDLTVVQLLIYYFDQKFRQLVDVCGVADVHLGCDSSRGLAGGCVSNGRTVLPAIRDGWLKFASVSTLKMCMCLTWMACEEGMLCMEEIGS